LKPHWRTTCGKTQITLRKSLWKIPRKFYDKKIRIFPGKINQQDCKKFLE
jgi:hypothetical protein